jgi:signal transduction histidine kinase
MAETAVLVASQVAVQLVTWPLIIALIVKAARDRARWPLVLSIAATSILLAGSAITVLWPHLTLVAGAAWWFALPLILGTYPDGRFVPRWILIPVAGYVLYAVAFLVTAGAIAESGGGIVGFSSLLLLAAPVHRYLRRSTTQERVSVRWAILAVLIGVGGFVLIMLVEGGTVAEHGPVSLAAANLVGVIIPVGLALGLLRPRLLDVDRALMVTVSFEVAAILVGTAGFAAWWAAQMLTAEAATVVVAIVVALTTIPAAWLARRAAVQLVFRGRLDEDAAARRVDAALVALDDASDAPARVVESVADALGAAGAALVGDPDLTASVGTIDDAYTDVPIVYEGETLATLRTAPRPGESDLTTHDERVIRRLAAHAAPALHAARSVAELSQAHAETLRARAEERKRLRRDLHDDLSPTLSGLSLSAAAIARLARRGEDVIGASEQLATDVKAAAAQVRVIAYDLRPPVLDDLGLVAAIRNRVHGTQADRLQVRVHGDGLPPELPAAIDLAVLRIVQEAVENTRRHAQARNCDVRLAVDDGTLTVTVDDDGRGFAAGHRRGLGLDSIRERSRELGGDSEFSTSHLGGAAVRVRLPLVAGT